MMSYGFTVLQTIGFLTFFIIVTVSCSDQHDGSLPDNSRLIETGKDMEAALLPWMKDFPDDGNWGPLDIENFNSVNLARKVKVDFQFGDVRLFPDGIYVIGEMNFPHSFKIKGMDCQVMQNVTGFMFPLESKGKLSNLRDGDTFTIAAEFLFQFDKFSVGLLKLWPNDGNESAGFKAVVVD